MRDSHPRWKADAAFIAFARTALPELAGKAEELVGLIRRVSESGCHESCFGECPSCLASDWLRANGYGKEER